MNELKNFENNLDNCWNSYLEKKIMLNILDIILNNNNKNIFDINIYNDEINKKLDYYEIFYIKENINNFSNNILSEIIKLNEEKIYLTNIIFDYKYINNINYFTKSKLIEEISILQDNIYNINKQKFRLLRWNNKHNFELFDLNLNNILSKSNN